MNSIKRPENISWIVLSIISALLFQVAAIFSHILPLTHEIPVSFNALALGFHIIALSMAVADLYTMLISRHSAIGKVLGVCALLLLCTPFFFSFLPVTARDALIHHLAVPVWWNAANIIQQIDWHSWSYYPGLIHQSYAFLLRLGEEFAPALYHASFLILIAALTGKWLQSMQLRIQAIQFGIVLCISLPLYLRLATEPMVDLPLSYYFALGVSSLFWGNAYSVLKGSIGFKTLLIAGFAFGLALSTKYNALLALVCVSPFLLLRLVRVSGIIRGISAFIFINILLVVVFSPWAVRNLLWKSNPVYPLYQSVFSVEKKSETKKSPSSPSPLAQRNLLYDEGIEDFLATPFRMILEGKDGDPQYFDGVLLPLLLLFPLGFRSRTLSFIGLPSLIYWYAASLFTTGRVRYLVPIIPAVILLSAQGADNISRLLGKARSQYLLYCCSAIAIIMGSLYLQKLTEEKKLLEYLNGSLTQEEYLTQAVPEWKLIQTANTITKSDEKILLLFTANRFYYFQKPVISSGHFSGGYLIDLIRSVNNSDELQKLLKLRGVGSILLHLDRTKEFLSTQLSENESQIWNKFQSDNLEFIEYEKGYALFRVKSGIETAS